MRTRARMVNKATGASPPYSTTRETASSPVNFDSSIQSSTSDSSSCSSTMVCAEKDNIEDVVVMNKTVNKHRMLPYPSPINTGSSNSTPILSSLTFDKPTPLMSIGTESGYGSNANGGSFSTSHNINNSNRNRAWPVDGSTRTYFKYHQKKPRQTRQYQGHYHQSYCPPNSSQPRMPSSIRHHYNGDYIGNYHRTCCNCHGFQF